MTTPKIAIFYDWLNNWGGAERVLLNLLELYPQAELFCLVHDPQKTKWLPKKIKIHPSFLNQLPLSKTNPIFYTPLYNFAIEQFDFSDFDIVISTTSTIGHGLLTPPQTLFVCYFHNLNRYVYLTPPLYRPLTPLLKIYQKIDRILIHRPDHYFCNSKTVKKRLNKIYDISPTIINPGIDLDKFTPNKINLKSPYFLIVGRQVPHKKIDIVIDYFAQNSQHNLIIAGGGREHSKLVEQARFCSNIRFIEDPTDAKLVSLYQNCIALICPQLEDYGLTPIEAQACGKPVIAYGKGGNRETIINLKTGIFFKKQTAKSLAIAMQRFPKIKFDPVACQKNAQNFSQSAFMLNFSQQLSLLWTQKQTTTS